MNISKLAASNFALVTSMASESMSYAQTSHTTNTAGLPPTSYPGSRGHGRGAGEKSLKFVQEFLQFNAMNAALVWLAFTRTKWMFCLQGNKKWTLWQLIIVMLSRGVLIPTPATQNLSSCCSCPSSPETWDLKECTQ